MMNVMSDGKKVEVAAAAVGYEGTIGVRMFFDDDEAFAHAICQAPGQVLKMDAEVFWDDRPGTGQHASYCSPLCACVFV